MKTYPIFDENTGDVLAFEIEHIYVSNSVVTRILSQVPEVSDIRVRKMFSKWQEIHVWFKYQEGDFVVWEPYGDSSRYWIGPKDNMDASVHLGDVMAAFEKYQPPLLIEVIGDVISFKIPSSVRRVLEKFCRR
jgi:hypothetical protein